MPTASESSGDTYSINEVIFEKLVDALKQGYSESIHTVGCKTNFIEDYYLANTIKAFTPTKTILF